MLNTFFQIPTYILFVIIFCLIIFANWSGYRYKKWQIKKTPGQVRESMGSIEGAMLGVMSLLMGFSFSVAVSKYEARRQLTITEANYIRTAILRCDMYPDSIRNKLRTDFKEYVEARVAYYKAGYNEYRITEELENAETISGRLWKTVMFYSNDLSFRVRSGQMIPNLNQMIEIVVTRDAQRISKVPPLILWTLLILVLIAAFLLGNDFEGHKRNVILLVGYALVMTLTLNLINELNHPRQGLINLDQAEKKMEDLRKLVL